MKLEVGKWYKARNGLRAFVCSADPIGGSLRLAHIYYEDGERRYLFAESGRAFVDLNINTPYDIVEERKDETSMASPIQEKTVKELVPGVYGSIEIIEEDKNTVLCAVTNYMTSSELRAAAKIFMELAEYLDEQK